MSDTNNADKTKRIVLIGYPGSGKTMLAIGLYKGGDRGSARISIDSEKNAKAEVRLIGFIKDIEKNKKFPTPTQLLLGDNKVEKKGDEEKSDRSTYPFQILWRGQKFDFEFEDYAGERTSDPEYIKDFFEKIVGKKPLGAVLLLNPGMPEFKNADDKCEETSRRPERLSNFYVTAINKLCESGCKNIVLAITASDLIGRGGSLRREDNSIRWLKFKNACRVILNSFKSTKSGSEQDNKCGLCPRFKMFCKRVFQSVKKAIEDLRREDYVSRYSRFKKVRDDIMGTLKNAKKNKALGLNYAVVPVTVTGRLEEQGEGEQKKEIVRFAEGRRNTAAEPFLWIINPWRGRIIKFVKLIFGVLVVLYVAWIASRHWYAAQIDKYLETAETALGNFGDPDAKGSFNEDNAKTQLDEAEKALRAVDNAFTFFDHDEEQKIKRWVPELVGTLLTNEVRLAYYNACKEMDRSSYNDTNVSLEGRNEFESWPKWKKSERGTNVVEAAEVFRKEKTDALIGEYVKSNVEYLTGQLQSAAQQLPNDQRVGQLMKQVKGCLEKMKDEHKKDDLKFWQKKFMRLWMKDVSKDDAEKIESRIRIVVTDETDLDDGETGQEITRLRLISGRIKAVEAVYNIKQHDSAQFAANNLHTYIISSSGKESPFRWRVFDACKDKFNHRVQDVLSVPDKRKDGFDELFHAAKKLKQIQAELERAGNDNLLEETFGDCALFWLSQSLKADMKKSDDWLCYYFSCKFISVRTDHSRNNPRSPSFFQHKVWAKLSLSFPSDISTAPRFFEMKEQTFEFPKDDNGETKWRTILDSKINERRMKATEVIRLTVCEGEEDDWWVDINFPRKSLEFWPGWGNCADEFPYKSKTDVYPNDVFFCARIDDVQITDSPKEAFDKALASAKAREDSIRELRDKELVPAEKELQAEKQMEGPNDHE